MTEFAAGPQRPPRTTVDGRGLALTAAVAALVVGAALIAAAVVLQHSGVVFVGGGTRSFGWYGYSPLSSG